MVIVPSEPLFDTVLLIQVLLIISLVQMPCFSKLFCEKIIHKNLFLRSQYKVLQEQGVKTLNFESLKRENCGSKWPLLKFDLKGDDQSYVNGFEDILTV